MGGVDENVEEHLIEGAGTWARAAGQGRDPYHLCHILPLIARHSDGALDGLVEIDTDLFLGARMENSFMARTMVATRSTPSRDCWIAGGFPR